MHELQWYFMKDFLSTGNFGSFEMYKNLTMSNEQFDAKFPVIEEVEERVQ